MSKRKLQVRTLTFLRHAKSSWKNAALADIDRPLTKRGRRDADAMALRIIEKGGSLDVVFASPARRVRETVFRVINNIPVQEARLVFDSALYTFDGSTLIEELKTLDDDLLHVTVVGHNPALQDAIGWLVGCAVSAFPTTACAQLTMPVAHWSDLKNGCATLDWLLVPERKREVRH